MGKITRARRKALQWFDEHERDPLSKLFGDKPSTRMRRLMVKEGHVARLPVGQFGYERWVLTFAGREALALAKPGKQHADHDEH